MLVARDVEVSVADGVSILGPVSLELAPGSLVALMGASGSGKSTLLRVMAGISEPSAGTALWASEATASAVRALGYVPQRESIHDRLTTREALSYAASLRLDATAPSGEQVDRVLDELGLVGRADTLIRNLSGGERRRAACGLELVGNPPVLLLDEPTSGLDAVLERRLMQLFRQLADHGRAVIVATHATASLDLCDQVIVLQEGLPAFRGSPSEARGYLGAGADGRQPASHSDQAISARPADIQPLTGVPHGQHVRAGAGESMPPTTTRPAGLELQVLTSRYFRTLVRDRRTLALLLGQAPVIGLLITIVFHPGSVGSTSASPINAIDLIFLLMTGSIWLGVTSSCREVVKERGLVEREFDVGVRLDAYVFAKALVLFALNFVQVLWLTLVVLGLQPIGVGPGPLAELFVIAVLTAWTSAAMGLVVSCVARSVDQAAGAVPLLLMPQLLLAGGLIPLAQMPHVVASFADVIYARWSYAGLSSAAQIGQRLAEYSYSSALGFDTGFFSLAAGTAALILGGFTLVELLLAVLCLMSRPSVDP